MTNVKSSRPSAPQAPAPPTAADTQPPIHNDDAGWRNGNQAHNLSNFAMLFLRRHPRFAFLLSSLLTIALVLLLPFSPFPSLPSSSASLRRPLGSSTGPQGLAARVRRAERAYQKMLLGRDALIAKVGPAPHNVALYVFYPSILSLISFSYRSGFHRTRNRGHLIQFVSHIPRLIA